ncbi:MAG: nicotinate mononucleotide-dependent phosphoribosyltransferase CobT [Cyanobacteria bacterium P01_G01_bin.54]
MTLVKLYTQPEQGQDWLQAQRGKRPHFACILGFTATGLITGISAAGATPADRQTTAIADAEFLYHGPIAAPQYPLPPLHQGASPALISRAIVASLGIPVTILNAGLPIPPPIPAVDLQGQTAACVSTGQALTPSIVRHLLQQGLTWGEKLATERETDYLIIGECVVGGTTTALGLLLGLGIPAQGCVNSSHPQCNHHQKQQLVEQGLAQAQLEPDVDPIAVVAAVGDPMQIVAAGMAIAASRHQGVLLAGGTQMLAVYALAQALATARHLPWQPQQVIVGTTDWVMADKTGQTVRLAQMLGPVVLVASQLDFSAARFASLRAYEQGYVKEGVGAGGMAIAAHLYRNWDSPQVLQAVEAIAALEEKVKREGGRLCELW